MKNFLLIGLFCSLFGGWLCAGDATAQTSLTFSVTDGKTKDVLLSMSANEPAKQTTDIAVQQTLSKSSGHPRLWKSTITNTGRQQRWLLLKWNVAYSGSSELGRLHYWNGNGKPLSGDALLHTQGLASASASLGTIMLQTIYDDNTGLALALNPREIVSQLEQSLLTPSQTRIGADTKGHFALQLQIPLVLDAGQSDSFPVEIYRFKQRYGFLDALQDYYQAHPDAFGVRHDIDPRAAGVGSAYTAWNEHSFERTRRFGGDWDWCYAPFKRTGDIYGRPQFWNYAPARPIPQWEAGFTPEEFRANRQQRFEAGAAAGAAMLFYVPSFIYCEENLAKEQYAGAILRKPDGQYLAYYDTPWVTGHDNEVMIYPWANKFAHQSMEDAAQVVQDDNDISGFAYDTLNGGYAFRDEGMEGSPRRAFDKDGVYVDIAVGEAKMMDFTRNLQKGDLKMALVGNPSGNSRAFLVARCDSAMYERAPYKELSELIPLRYGMGHKPITWWAGWNISDMIDWQHMAPTEIRDAYHGAADYVRLVSYRYGGYPSSLLAQGVPSLTRALPLLKEVLSQGWQAVPAVRAQTGELPPFIWPSRYGSGLGSYVTLGNAQQTPWSGRVVIDNDYLGNRNYLFVDEKGQPQAQTLQGRTTVLDLHIQPHQVLALRAVAAVADGASGSATVSWKDDGAHGKLQITSAFAPTQTTSLRSGWKLLRQNGKSWNFTSPYFASPLQDIVDFPFFGNGHTALIVLPPKPSADEQWAASHIQQYFQFWAQNGIQPPQAIELKISQGPAPRAADLPLIYIGGSKDIRRKGLVLQVGSAPGTLRAATLKLLAALDQKYFYCGTFPGAGEGTGEAAVIKKAGL